MVGDWLRGLDMSEYAGAFARAGVDADMLRKLTSADLQELGVSLADRLKMLPAIAELNRVRNEAERRSDARTDFVRRFIAVAISVGFAGSIVRMRWLTEGWPNVTEWEQILRLLTAFVLVLLGWEWHHKDLGLYGQTTQRRFFIDVAVVVFGLLFLITSSAELVWLFCLVMIFAFYVAWDHATVIEPSQRENAVIASTTNKLWLAYFVAILVVDYFLFSVTSFTHTLVLCSAILAGAICLTFQGNNPPKWEMRDRVGVVCFLLICFIFYSFVFHRTLLPDELRVDEAQILNGRLVVAGGVGLPNRPVRVAEEIIQSDAHGVFRDSLNVPPSCVVRILYAKETF
jgi:hypothetical protein